MTQQNDLASQLKIKLDNTEVQRDVMTKLAEVLVDQHAHIPDLFVIRLNDPGLEVLDNGPFDLAKEVEIASETTSGEDIVLIKGEITALEPEFNEGMIATLVVRGYDKSHRLFREVKSKTYLNVKDSDLATQIAQNAGLQADVETTSTVYDHIYQDNLTDMGFLMQRAWRIGFECYVNEGKLVFRKPSTSSANISLTWGDDLVTFQPRMTLAEQVEEVVVKGWDVDQQKAIVGKAKTGNLYPQISESKNGAQWSHNFGTGKKVFVDLPVASQAEADQIATARLDEISGSFIEADGVALRRPDIKAGAMVELNGLGNRLSGKYLVTNATHVYSSEGLRTTFYVRGTRTGSIIDHLTHDRNRDRWPGVIPGVVTNTDDPSDWGRVKVKFPWMSDDAESDWARVIGLGAGPEAGIYAIPEVGDEVMVAFVHGDFSQPVVLGGVWNGQNAIPPEAAGAASGEKPLVRTWHSRTGHLLAMYDNSDNKVEIVTAGGHKATLDDANQKIILTSSGGLTLTLDDSSSKITIESSNEIEIKASGNLKMQAGANMDLQASGQMNIKGTMVNIN